MSVCSWNCHGLGNLWAIQILIDMVYQKKPTFLFLCETKYKRSRLEVVQRKIGFEGAFVVEAQAIKGGLALMWRNQMRLHYATFQTTI